MTFKSPDRRDFLKQLGMVGIGSSVFSLGIPKGSWAASVADKDCRKAWQAMGTVVHLVVIGEKENKAREAVLDAIAEIQLVEDLMSIHRRFTPLSRVNRVAGSEMLEVDPRIIEVVRSGLRWAKQSGALFDITALPLLKAGGLHPEADDIPDTIAEARELVDYRQIRIEGRQLGLQRKGMGFDLGGIAKGYAVDRAIAVLRDKWGIANAIVEAGGDLYVHGCPTDAPGWKVGLQDPTRAGVCAIFELANQAIATSGNYDFSDFKIRPERMDKFNPQSGERSNTYLSSSAFAATCMEADAASTALFVAGRDASPDLLPAGVSGLNLDLDANGGLKFVQVGEFPSYRRV